MSNSRTQVTTPDSTSGARLKRRGNTIPIWSEILAELYETAKGKPVDRTRNRLSLEGGGILKGKPATEDSA